MKKIILATAFLAAAGSASAIGVSKCHLFGTCGSTGSGVAVSVDAASEVADILDPSQIKRPPGVSAPAEIKRPPGKEVSVADITQIKRPPGSGVSLAANNTASPTPPVRRPQRPTGREFAMDVSADAPDVFEASQVRRPLSNNAAADANAFAYTPTTTSTTTTTTTTPTPRPKRPTGMEFSMEVASSTGTGTSTTTTTTPTPRPKRPTGMEYAAA